MSAWELVGYFGRLYGMSEQRLQERLDEVFTRLQMNDFRDMLGAKMSTGMKQRRITIFTPASAVRPAVAK